SEIKNGKIKSIYREDELEALVKSLDFSVTSRCNNYFYLFNLVMNYYNLKGCLEQQILNNYHRVLNCFSNLIIGLDFKAEEHKKPILMTSQNFDSFIIQETNTRLKTNYTYEDILHKALKYYCYYFGTVENNPIVDYLNQLEEKFLDKESLINLYNKVNYIGVFYIDEKEVITLADLKEIGLQTLLQFKEQCKKPDLILLNKFKSLKNKLNFIDSNVDDELKYKLTAKSIIELQKHIKISEITLYLNHDKTNTSEISYYNFLFSYCYNIKEYISILGSKVNCLNFILEHFTSLFELLNNDISLNKDLSYLKNINLNNFDKKQIDGKNYFSLYNLDIDINIDIDKAIKLDIAKANNYRSIAILQEDFNYNSDNELFNKVYIPDISNISEIFEESKKNILLPLKELQAIDYFFNTISLWLDVDIEALRPNLKILNSNIDSINDLILEIDSLCITDEDITTYFNTLPIIKKDEYLLEIADESSLQKWLIDPTNYNLKLSTKPLEKILNIDKLSNVIGYT
ncbi:MAG: hypothetical protein HQ490_10850, partial [Lutibacter sp.]|nr:hypothetical protein [Lutibacter sp.]